MPPLPKTFGQLYPSLIPQALARQEFTPEHFQMSIDAAKFVRETMLLNQAVLHDIDEDVSANGFSPDVFFDYVVFPEGRFRVHVQHVPGAVNEAPEVRNAAQSFADPRPEADFEFEPPRMGEPEHPVWDKPSPDIERACSTCKHSTFDPKAPRALYSYGECARHAPKMYGEVERDMPSGAEPRMAVWPRVVANEVCGEWERGE